MIDNAKLIVDGLRFCAANDVCTGCPASDLCIGNSRHLMDQAADMIEVLSSEAGQPEESHVEV